VGENETRDRIPVYGYLLSNGRYTTLALSEFETTANGINASGQIVGSYLQNGSHGFLLSGGTSTTLDVPGSIFTVANGINTSGQIVGAYQEGPNGRMYGFLLSEGSYASLEVPGSTATSANDINGLGQVVGGYTDTNGREHGFVLSGGTYVTFDVPGSTLTSVNGINNFGQIVGIYQIGGRQYGYLATPVPEPSTLVLLGISTLALPCGYSLYRHCLHCG
jgi:probable HAF family extracellular repeat protein